MQRLQIGKYYQQSYANKLNPSDKMGKFIKRQHAEDRFRTGNTHIPTAILETESEFRNFPTKGTSGPNDANSEISQTRKEELVMFP